MTTKVIDYTVTLTATDCAECSIVFGVPGRFLDERRQDKRTFYCPNGHMMSFHRTEADRLRGELQRAQDATARAEAAARSQRAMREAEERSHRATKGVLTKTRRRVANGVCPCCSRTFANLQRHMASQHPDFAEPSA